MTGPRLRSTPGRMPSARSGSSRGVLSPSAHQERRSHDAGACLTPAGALSGFLTLSAPCSPPVRPILFHTGNARGVLPFRAFPSRGAVPPPRGRCPPGVCLIASASPTPLSPHETGAWPAARSGRRMPLVSARPPQPFPSRWNDRCRGLSPACAEAPATDGPAARSPSRPRRLDRLSRGPESTGRVVLPCVRPGVRRASCPRPLTPKRGGDASRSGCLANDLIRSSTRPPGTRPKRSG
jgi:hypothetical protein